jgi:hypothetical protein
MKVTEIRYQRRWSDGKFNHEDIGVTASLDDGEKASECFPKIKDLVLRQHVETPPQVPPTVPAAPAPKLAVVPKPVTVAVPAKPASIQAKRLTETVLASATPLTSPDQDL